MTFCVVILFLFGIYLPRFLKNIFHHNEQYNKVILIFLIFFLKIYSYTPSFSQAPNQIDSLQRLLSKTKDSVSRADILYKLGISSYRVDPNRSIEYGKACLKIARDLEHMVLISNAYQVLCVSHLNLGDYDLAIDYALKEIEAAKKSGRNTHIATGYHDLALVYDDIGEYQKSLANNFKALQLRRSLIDSTEQNLYGYRSLGFSYNNIGAVYFSISKLDSALFYFKKGLEVRIIANHEYGIAESYTNMGFIYEHLGMLDSALYYGHKSLQIEKKINDLQGIANTYINLASANYKKGNINEAKNFLDSSITIANEVYIPKRLLEAYDLYKDIHTDQGDYERALEFYEQYANLKDSVFNAEKANQIANLEIKYEAQRKESEIEFLKSETALKEAALNRQQILRNIIIGGAVILIILILMLFHRYRYAQKLKMIEAERVQELDRIKSNFFANISHEFRTPLTLIKGSLHKLMQNNPVKDSRDLQLEYQSMQRHTNRLLQLINQLLELSRLDDGKVSLKTVKREFSSYLKRIVISFASFAEQRKINLLFNDAPVDAPGSNYGIYVYFDAEKIDKIFYNLLANAIRFAPENGEVKVTLNIMEEADFLEIKISNTGEGIPPEKLPYVFDRFYQADDNSTRRYEGTGIGLSMVKELIELHRGTITAESTPGVLTVFTVTLPLGSKHLKPEEIIHEDDNNEIPREALAELNMYTEQEMDDEDTPEKNNSLDKTYILIVEDHAELRQYIKENLSKEYQVLEAKNGKEGLKKAVDYIPDLVISDVMMPHMDGFEMCKILKKNDKTEHIPIILLTAKVSVENKLEGLEFGADDYLIKPFNPDELQTRVRNLIQIRKLLREKFTQQIDLKPKNITVSSTQKIFLDKLMKVLEENMGNENFGVEELGQEIGMSRAQTHRKIKALTNQPPSEFIRKFRLQRAAELIRQDAGNLAEIAYQVGFNSQAYFTRSFQEVYKCSPSEFKKKHLMNNS